MVGLLVVSPGGLADPLIGSVQPLVGNLQRTRGVFQLPSTKRHETMQRESEKEEAYFARIECEKRKKLEEEKHKQLLDEEALKIYEEKLE